MYKYSRFLLCFSYLVCLSILLYHRVELTNEELAALALPLTTYIIAKGKGHDPERKPNDT